MKEYLKKYKLYIIIGVSILILSVGGTLAYYIWSSNTNAIVNTEVCTPTVTFAGGSTINGVDIVPVLTKEEGHTAATNFVLYNGMNSGYGQDRYEKIKAKQEETNGIMSEDEAMDLLLSVPAQGMREVEGGEGIPSDTQWSCVYNLDDLTLQICTTRDKSRTYNYSLK